MSVLPTPEKTRRDSDVASVTGAVQELARPERCAVGWFAAPEPRSLVDHVCRWIVQRELKRMAMGQIELVETYENASGPSEPAPVILVHDPRFYRRVLLGGSLGAAESFLRGEWGTADLVKLMREFAHHTDALGRVDRGFARLLHPLRLGLNWLRRNTRAGSRRNIASHYDLSNEFFSLMLDPTMTYSSGIFESPNATMQQASLAKYDRICRKLEFSSDDHVLEIGSGWGGFAIYASKNYGCRVTTTTISRQQHDYARKKIQQAGLAERVTLLLKDYRDLDGRYDKLVAIEMIEAVGKRFLNTFFRQCSKLLQPDGMMLLQAITIPDHRFRTYCQSIDFIQHYIFPGGFLPSFSSIGQALRRGTDFRLLHSEDFSPHYAETLACWRRKFWRNIDRIRSIGFDDRFVRMWHYYLCYSEAGFQERQIGVSQLLLSKPACRRKPISDDESVAGRRLYWPVLK